MKDEKMTLSIVTVDKYGVVLDVLATGDVGTAGSGSHLAMLWQAIEEATAALPPADMSWSHRATAIEYRHPWFVKPVGRIAIDWECGTHGKPESQLASILEAA